MVARAISTWRCASFALATSFAALVALATAAALATAQTALSAVKVKTDKLTFDASNRVEANTTAVNDVALTGVGTTGDPWGPA